MNKLLNKLFRRNTADSSRITTETIAQHRKRILAGGRRFKYPVQYARHKLVFNAVIITVATVLVLVGVGYWQLYPAQNTSDFIYRVTRVLPLPVASIDGSQVRYSDYLMKYRSSIHYLEEKERVNLKNEDGKRQSDFVKQQAMDDALADTYATTLAKQRGITVSDAELESFLKQQRTSSDGEVSQATYDAVILDYYGWSPEEYRHAMHIKLLRQKVSYAVDDQAKKTADDVATVIKNGATDLKSVADTVNKTASPAVTYGALGLVPKTNQDGGLALAATKLKVGEISPVIRSTTGDGYYFIKLLEINDTQVNYEYVHIPLTVFSRKLASVKAAGQVHEYISIPKVDANGQRQN